MSPVVREPVAIADPDRDIVERIGGGEHVAALQLVMQRHGTAVYRYCRQELHDPVLADDVHQEVFVQVHRDMASFAGRSTFRTWLFAIARNRVCDATKARRRADAHFEDDVTADAPDPAAAPGQQIDEARLIQILLGCVDQLSDAMRTAVLLRYQQSFTFEEMAVICNEKAGTLQARVARALRVLRAWIEARTGERL